jgi:hypothetical protein
MHNPFETEIAGNSGTDQYDDEGDMKEKDKAFTGSPHTVDNDVGEKIDRKKKQEKLEPSGV